MLLGEPSAGGIDDVRRATALLAERVAAGLDAEMPPVSMSAFGYTRPPALDNLISIHVARHAANAATPATPAQAAATTPGLAVILIASTRRPLAGQPIARGRRRSPIPGS